MTGEMEDNAIWYKLICQHCDKDGYIYMSYKLPLDSENIDNPNSTERTPFEVLPHDREGYVRIRRKCNNCGGLKEILYSGEEWQIEIFDPKPMVREEK